jgi:hypothetical protein
MSGVTPLVDTLLATRLGQRVDLVPLKAQVEIAGPGAVANVEKVGNDVRLPSREALQSQLGVGVPGQGGVPAGPAHAETGGAVMLSAVARTVSALLELPAAGPAAVRGQVALQPDMRASTVPVLAAALVRTVAESGLFYESHLQQYAAGQRTLAQLAREPQAGLAAPAAGVQPPDVSPPSPATAAVVALASLAKLLEGMAALPPAPSPSPPPSPLPPLLLEGGPVLDMPQAEAAAPLPADSGARPAAGAAAAPGSPAMTYGPSGQPDPLPPIWHDFSVPDAGTPVPLAASSDTARVAQAAHAAQPAAAIHPDAVGLVRQQLEMLAQPVFRWSGEGWPGIPIDWEIRQEGNQYGWEEREEREKREGLERREGGGAPEVAPAAWVTRLTLELPRLGTVDVHLGLAGTALQLRLDASRQGTAAGLEQAGAELSRRLSAAGLALTELRVGSMPGTPDLADLADQLARKEVGNAG